jgi:hypothetical protein
MQFCSVIVQHCLTPPCTTDCPVSFTLPFVREPNDPLIMVKSRVFSATSIARGSLHQGSSSRPSISADLVHSVVSGNSRVMDTTPSPGTLTCDQTGELSNIGDRSACYRTGTMAYFQNRQTDSSRICVHVCLEVNK